MLVKTGFIATSLIFAFVWSAFASDYFINQANYDPDYLFNQQLGDGADPEAQLERIFKYPGTFLKTLIISYKESAFATAAHYVGKFGWGKNYIPFWAIAILWFTILLNSLSVKEKVALSVKKRLFLILITGMLVLGFSIGIYCQWDAVASPRIMSLSGRYFIPILPLLFISFPHLKILDQIPIWIINRIVIIAALVITVFEIYSRYY